MVVIITSIIASLSVGVWIASTATDGLRDIPRFLADPSDRWRFLAELLAGWPLYAALLACACGCVWLLVRIGKRGRV